MEEVKSLISYLGDDPNNYIGWAIENGHLEILQYVYENHYYDSECLEECINDSVVPASNNGHVEIIAYVWENIIADDDTFDKEVLVMIIAAEAAENGNLEIIKYMYDNFSYEQLECIVDEAFVDNNLDIIKYVHKKSSSEFMNNLVAESLMDHISYNDQLEMMQYLHNNSIGEYTWRSIIDAAETGRLETVKFLYDNYSHLFRDKDIIESIEEAANNGHQDIVMFLKGRYEYCGL